MPSNNLITFRKGTSAEWSSANPVLALGEPGFDTTNNQIRIGDGVSNWNNLPVIGAQGVQGIQGYDGLQGIQGVQGSDANMQGIQGIQGDQGIQGYDGAQGQEGIQGIQGQEGIQGAIPVLNFRGEYNSWTTYYLNDIVAYNNLAYAAIQNNFSNYDPTNTSYWQVFITQTVQGIQGVQGEQGIQGIQGEQGVQGIQGFEGMQGAIPTLNFRGEYNGATTYYLNDIVAYGNFVYAAIQNSFSGTDPSNSSYWVVMIAQTIQGIQGLQGDQGIQGLAGSDANMQGTQGIQGDLGVQGIQGEQGIQGYDGIQGTQGLQGSIPVLNFRGEYNSWTTYYLNDIVAYGSTAYVAIQDNFSNYDPASNPSYWAVFITQTVQGVQGEGIQGLQGISGIINWTGEYNGATTYYYNDGVSYNGSSYVAIQNSFSSTDPTNTAYWQLVASQGIQGLDGVQGYEGIQGIQGEQGIQGLDGIQGFEGPQGIQGFEGPYATVTNYADDRVLTSDGTSGGINAETYLTFDGTSLSAPYFISTNAAGDEGGEIKLTKPPNATLSAGITIDAYINKLRFFEDGGSSRGYYLNMDEGVGGAARAIINKTLCYFTPLDNQPPASAFATLDTRNSIAVLDFDDTTQESAVFVGIIPENAALGSGISVRIHWMATSATTGSCRWGVQFEKMTTDLDSDSFDTATEAHSTTNGTSGIITTTSITCTTIDSLAAGDLFRIKIYRDVTDTTNDTMTGDAEIVAVELRSVI